MELYCQKVEAYNKTIGDEAYGTFFKKYGFMGIPLPEGITQADFEENYKKYRFNKDNNLDVINRNLDDLARRTS